MVCRRYATQEPRHDGGAADLREMLIDRNPKNRHGRTSHLSSQEIDDLIEYLLSL